MARVPARPPAPSARLGAGETGNGDRDRDGVADELEVTITFLLDGDGGDPAGQRVEVLDACDQMKDDAVIVGYRVESLSDLLRALRGLAAPEPDEPLQGRPENVAASDRWIAERNWSLGYARRLD